MRQKTEDMRLVADLADAGNVRGAIAILGERVIESKNRIAAAAGAWLALPADERYKTTLLPSSRDGRSEANQIIQDGLRSEEHTSELQSLMRISYAVFCLKKKKQKNKHIQQMHHKTQIQTHINHKHTYR